ncbi:MAG: hypothetical protein AB1430_10300 [Pseudomonadota bacterium]
MSEDDRSALRRLVDEANDEHYESPEAAGRRLLSGLELLPGDPRDAEYCVRIAEHLLLGHLADAAALMQVLERVHPLAGDAVLDATVARARLAADLVENLQALPASSVPAADRVRALYNAALARLQRADWPGVAERMEAAQAIGTSGNDAAALRAYAAMMNNIASEIRSGFSTEHRLDAAKVGTMLDAAQRAREAWSRAGGWKETERADYLLAMCCALAGQAAPALAHARACLAGCEANNADAYERFFAHEALAHAYLSADQMADASAQRDRMATLLPRILDGGSQQYAADTLRQLNEKLRLQIA